jgi:tetratricopeptide (TPR) repeat protein
MPFPKALAPALAAALLSACTGGMRMGGSPTVDPEPGFDRAACGTAPLPLWSAFTPPEIRALQNRDRAAAGDAHALLDLAILASGDKRTAGAYDSIRARFDAFVAKERPLLAAEKTAWQKGYRLHRDMHTAFFPAAADAKSAEGGGAQPGYDAAQSALTGIFADGTYNGVVLSSHAFAEITLPDGKVIEVETTTPTGYDWVHDEKFYKQRAAAWFSSRGLPASSYKDYQARSILDPVRLIAGNMWNQHTGSGRMRTVDRYRLAEARAWIDPDDAEAQNNRVAVYAAEYGWLSKREDWPTVDRFLRAVGPALPALRKRWDADAELANHIAWLPYYHAHALRALGKTEAVFGKLDTALAWLKPEVKEGPVLRGNCVSVLILATQDMAARKEFAAAEGQLLRYPNLLRDDANLRGHLTWLYQEWSAEAWKRNDWEATTATLGKSLPYAPKEHLKPLRNNLSSAYYNWYIVHNNEGDWPKAKDVLRRCLETVPDDKRCKTQLQELVAQHNLDP